ncbi:MAG: hypothetical protein RLN88_12345 [Ekhidna sp.]|uniref:hypothetical protein n=1 Tax=Ekhidna sp. TaxID=2608089 RepID=UPI0032EB9887
MKLVKLFIITILITSCAATKVKVNTLNDASFDVDELNLTSVMIGPVWQPVLPLIDASAFNAKTNKIAAEIMEEEQKIIERYKELLVENIRKNVDAKLVLSSELNDSADKYRIEKGVNVEENENFPVVFFAEGDLNFFEFDKKGINVNAIFKNNEALSARIATITQELGVENVLISFTRIEVISPGMFGASAQTRLGTYLYLFNSSGKLVMDAYGWSKPVNIKGKEIQDYKIQLDNFHGLAILMGTELANYLK